MTKKLKQIKMKVKQWNKYDDNAKEQIQKKYDVILTDHETRKERINRYAKSVNKKNFDKGLEKFDSSLKKFDSGMDKGLGKSKGSTESRIYGKKKTKDAIYGSSSSGKIFGSKSSNNVFGNNKRVRLL